MKRFLNAVCITAAILWLAAPASATPVTFQGGAFDIVVTDLGGDVYRFVYSADFTGWDDSTDDDFITSIEFGLPGWNDIDDVTLVGETAPGDWDVVQGNGSANNCNENLNQFKICAQEDSLLLSASTQDDQIYAWTIDVAYGSIGDLAVLTSSANHIGAIYYELDCKTNNRTDEVECSPKQTGSMNLRTDYGAEETETTGNIETTTGDVPEPTVMALMGASLMLIGRRLRRKAS